MNEKEVEASVWLAVNGRKTPAPVRDRVRYEAVVRRRLKCDAIREKSRAPSPLTIDVPIADARLDDVDTRDLVDTALSLLESDLERKIVELWIAGCTYEQIGVAVDRTPRYAQKVKCAAVKRMKRFLTEKEVER